VAQLDTCARRGNAGFTVKEEEYLKEFTPEQKERYRLPVQEEVYVAMK